MTGRPTPALVVDLEVLRRNLDAADQLLDGTGKKLRPHVKAHRTPALARMQVRHATTGITCATVGEAEVMVDHGLSDVLLANEVATEDKLDRVLTLNDRATIAVAADSVDLADLYDRAARRRGQRLHVLVDLDTGLGRCGVRSVEEAVALARRVEEARGLVPAGLMAYEGRLRATPMRPAAVGQARDLLRRCAETFSVQELALDTVSVGGTSTLRDWISEEAVTEIQAGTYALMENDLDGLGLPFQCAAWVEGSVVSRNGREIVVDVGRKTIGCEYGLPTLIGLEGCTRVISEEHSVVECAGSPPPLGSIVRLRPGQIRTTCNLYDHVYLHEGRTRVHKVPVAARGRSQ